PEETEPEHEVELTRPFWLGVFPVTQREYELLTGHNPSAWRRGALLGLDTSSFPVGAVSWFDAVAFCAELSRDPRERAAGRRYRLPSEAEWEYACRAGTTTAFHFGESIWIDEVNYFAGENADGQRFGLERPCAVGSYPPNAFGLYDMHGNID